MGMLQVQLLTDRAPVAERLAQLKAQEEIKSKMAAVVGDHVAKAKAAATPPTAEAPSPNPWQEVVDSADGRWHVCFDTCAWMECGRDVTEW